MCVCDVPSPIITFPCSHFPNESHPSGRGRAVAVFCLYLREGEAHLMTPTLTMPVEMQTSGFSRQAPLRRASFLVQLPSLCACLRLTHPVKQFVHPLSIWLLGYFVLLPHMHATSALLCFCVFYLVLMRSCFICSICGIFLDLLQSSASLLLSLSKDYFHFLVCFYWNLS